MGFINELYKRAGEAKKTIVLCEGEDKRIVQAAAQIVKQGIAKIILLGTKEEAETVAPGVDLSGIKIINPATSTNAQKYAEILFNERKGKKNKNGELEYKDVAAAKEYIKQDRTMFGALLLKAGDADGFVSGACHSTANTLRPGLQVIKTAPKIKTISSCCIMVAPEGVANEYISDSVSLFADCGINIEPTADEIADIAAATAETAKKIAGIEPRVALLSFSTKGSGNDDKYFKTVPKMQEALKIAKERYPELIIDGELQFDAAVSTNVAKLKAPGSNVAGRANIFVFPNLNAGNIGYKICQRMGGWMALGPVCQGFSKPLNDLSRGCHVKDIVATVAVTALQ